MISCEHVFRGGWGREAMGRLNGGLRMSRVKAVKEGGTAVCLESGMCVKNTISMTGS